MFGAKYMFPICLVVLGFTVCRYYGLNVWGSWAWWKNQKSNAKPKPAKAKTFQQLLDETDPVAKLAKERIFENLVADKEFMMKHVYLKPPPLPPRGGKAEFRTNCTKGASLFDKAWIKAEFDNFITVLLNRPMQEEDYSGIQLNHLFALFAITRQLNPEYIIESGVNHGIATWIMRQAAPAATFILLDPKPNKPWYIDKETSTVYRTDKTKDHRQGEGFEDFNRIDWVSLDIPKSRALVFFNDHQNHVRRVLEAWRRGFIHLVFDDNYLVDEGDTFSLQQACAVYWNLVDKEDVQVQDKAGKESHSLSSLDTTAARMVLEDLLDLVYEFPILWKSGRTKHSLFEDMTYEELKANYSKKLPAHLWSQAYRNIVYARMSKKYNKC